MADSINPAVIHLICSSGFYGAERVVANLCRAFPEFRTEVLCMAPDSADLSLFEQQVAQAPTARFLRIANQLPVALQQLRLALRRHPNLVVHAHGYKEVLTATVFRLFYRCPVVVTQHGFTARNLKSRFYNWIDKACCRWGGVQSVIAVSGPIAEVYRRFGVSEQKLLVLENAIVSGNSSDTGQRKAEVAAAHQIPAEQPWILFAGRLSDEKDPLLFVETMAALAQLNPQPVGLIAGDGPLMNQVQERISTLGLDQQIRCLGFVDDISGLLPCADTLLLTSKTEGIPMILLEAMAAGTPVVSAAVGGVPDVIESGHNGILVHSRQPRDFANACRRLLGTPGHAGRIASQAQATVKERFSLRAQHSIYQSIYQGIYQGIHPAGGT